MRKIIAIALPCVAGWICTYLAIYFFQDYALGLFILLPIVMGIMSTLITTYHSSLPKGKLFTYSILSLLFYCLGIFLLAWDGAICIIMALPIGLVFNLAGVAIGYIFVSKKIGDSTTTLLAVFLAVPVFMAFEDSRKKSETLRTVTTSIEIKASPEEIWKTVIGFPRLDDRRSSFLKPALLIQPMLRLTAMEWEQ
jgi:CHASE2 domain-containing sensor protein